MMPAALPFANTYLDENPEAFFISGQADSEYAKADQPWRGGTLATSSLGHDPMAGQGANSKSHGIKTTRARWVCNGQESKFMRQNMVHTGLVIGDMWVRPTLRKAGMAPRHSLPRPSFNKHLSDGQRATLKNQATVLLETPEPPRLADPLRSTFPLLTYDAKCALPQNARCVPRT